jgi:AraC-like DNA-binding protein
MKEVFEAIFLLAAGQGILLTIVLVARKENHTANRILAIATLLLSIDLVTAVYYSKGWFLRYPHLMGFSYPFPTLYGPLFYLYAAFVSKIKNRFGKFDWLHFVPAATVYILSLPVFFYSGEEKIAFLRNMMHGNPPLLFAVFGAMIPIQGLLYTFFTIKITREYDRKIKAEFSNIDLVNLNWLKHITIAMIIIWSIVAILFIIRAATEFRSGTDGLIQLSISILIYSIGYKALKQPEIFLDPASFTQQSEGTTKYQRSGLSDDTAEEIKIKLLALMASDKPFLSQDLTLQKLAERLKTSSHNLSEVINTRLHLSYYDFINQHRIEEFKNRLADPESERYNLLSIAFDSGFQSKGTFNSIFKKFTGMTPSEYKGRLKSSSK